MKGKQEEETGRGRGKRHMRGERNSLRIPISIHLPVFKESTRSPHSQHMLKERKNEQKEVWHKRGKKRGHLKSVFILLSENGIKKCMCYVLRISNLKMQKALACQMPGIQSKFSGAIDHAPLLVQNS